MRGHAKRLARLEAITQRPPERSAPPFDPSRLTADELTELEGLQTIMAAADGDIRARLDVLTDAQFDRCRVLLYTGWGMDPTAPERESWGPA